MFLDIGMRLRANGKLNYVLPGAFAWRVDYRGGVVGRERWSILLRKERDRQRLAGAGATGWLRLQSWPWRAGMRILRALLALWMRLTSGRTATPTPVRHSKIRSWQLRESLWRWMK